MKCFSGKRKIRIKAAGRSTRTKKVLDEELKTFVETVCKMLAKAETAAGISVSVFGIYLSPMIASAAMTFNSVSVILNALQLRNLKL